MSEIINYIILGLLSVSTIIQICDMCGFLPDKLRKKIRINKTDDTIAVLKEFGVNINMYKRRNTVVGIPQDYSISSVESMTRDKLKEITIQEPISVGTVRKTELSYYIDLIGHTCNPDYAVSYARLLSSFWADEVERTQHVKDPIIEFIVTPKGGSPLLGYEFARLIGKPFVLHENSARFSSPKDDMRKYFDCATIPSKGSRALIVDDSTTGGKLVLDTIVNLRKYGYEVSECLVVFEPQHKDARRKLSDQEVNLISIVKTHTG